MITFSKCLSLHIEFSNIDIVKIINCEIIRNLVIKKTNIDGGLYINVSGSTIGKKFDISSVSFGCVPQISGASLPIDVNVSESELDWPIANLRRLDTVREDDLEFAGFNDRRSYEAWRHYAKQNGREGLGAIFRKREYDANLRWLAQMKERPNGASAQLFWLRMYRNFSNFGTSVTRPLGWALRLFWLSVPLHILFVAWTGEHFSTKPGIQFGQFAHLVMCIFDGNEPDIWLSAGYWGPKLAIYGMLPVAKIPSGLDFGNLHFILLYSQRLAAGALYFLVGLEPVAESSIPPWISA